MVNFYCTGVSGDRAQVLFCEHLRRPDVAYSLMDFDLSLKCPRDVSLRKCRVPVDVAWTSMYVPTDLYLAPPSYSPFAYDVACLGNLFRYTCRELFARSVCLLITKIASQELELRCPLEALLFDIK